MRLGLLSLCLLFFVAPIISATSISLRGFTDDILDLQAIQEAQTERHLASQKQHARAEAEALLQVQQDASSTASLMDDPVFVNGLKSTARGAGYDAGLLAAAQSGLGAAGALLTASTAAYQAVENLVQDIAGTDGADAAMEAGSQAGAAAALSALASGWYNDVYDAGYTAGAKSALDSYVEAAEEAAAVEAHIVANQTAAAAAALAANETAPIFAASAAAYAGAIAGWSAGFSAGATAGHDQALAMLSGVQAEVDASQANVTQNALAQILALATSTAVAAGQLYADDLAADAARSTADGIALQEFQKYLVAHGASGGVIEGAQWASTLGAAAGAQAASTAVPAEAAQVGAGWGVTGAKQAIGDMNSTAFNAAVAGVIAGANTLANDTDVINAGAQAGTGAAAHDAIPIADAWGASGGLQGASESAVPAATAAAFLGALIGGHDAGVNAGNSSADAVAAGAAGGLSGVQIAYQLAYNFSFNAGQSAGAALGQAIGASAGAMAGALAGARAGHDAANETAPTYAIAAAFAAAAEVTPKAAREAALLAIQQAGIPAALYAAGFQAGNDSAQVSAPLAAVLPGVAGGARAGREGAADPAVGQAAVQAAMAKGIAVAEAAYAAQILNATLGAAVAVAGPIGDKIGPIEGGKAARYYGKIDGKLEGGDDGQKIGEVVGTDVGERAGYAAVLDFANSSEVRDLARQAALYAISQPGFDDGTSTADAVGAALGASAGQMAAIGPAIDAATEGARAVGDYVGYLAGKLAVPDTINQTVYDVVLGGSGVAGVVNNETIKEVGLDAALAAASEHGYNAGYGAGLPAASAAADRVAAINASIIGSALGPDAARSAARNAANQTAEQDGMISGRDYMAKFNKTVHDEENSVIDRIANITAQIKATQDGILTNDDVHDFELRMAILEHEINRIRVHEGLAPRVSQSAVAAELQRRAEIRWLQERLANLSMHAQVYYWNVDPIIGPATPKYDPELGIPFALPRGPIGRHATADRTGTVPPSQSYHHNADLRASEQSPNSAHIGEKQPRPHNQGHVQVGGSAFLEEPIMIKRRSPASGSPASSSSPPTPSTPTPLSSNVISFAKLGPRRALPSWLKDQTSSVQPSMESRASR